VMSGRVIDHLGLDFKQCGFNHTHLALATHGTDYSPYSLDQQK
jgi:hypothetical protein